MPSLEEKNRNVSAYLVIAVGVTEERMFLKSIFVACILNQCDLFKPIGFLFSGSQMCATSDIAHKM